MNLKNVFADDLQVDTTVSQLKTLQLINLIAPEMPIGGSLGLKLNGLLLREPKDLDLIVSTESFKLLRKCFMPEKRGNYSGEKHFSFSVNGLEVCIFSVERSGLSGHEGEKAKGFYKQYTLQKPEYAIAAKKLYARNHRLKTASRRKHKKDLEIIKKLQNN